MALLLHTYSKTYLTLKFLFFVNRTVSLNVNRERFLRGLCNVPEQKAGNVFSCMKTHIPMAKTKKLSYWIFVTFLWAFMLVWLMNYHIKQYCQLPYLSNIFSNDGGLMMAEILNLNNPPLTLHLFLTTEITFRWEEIEI